MSAKVTLTIQQIALDVVLGVYAEERQKPQQVMVDIDFAFQQPPKGCQTDALQDTICYVEISQLLQTECDKKDYHLVEHLVWQLSEVLVRYMKKPVDIKIKAYKVAPVDHIDQCIVEVERYCNPELS